MLTHLLYAPLTKIDVENRMVYGYASTEAKDLDGEIITKAAVEAALPDYLRFSNIREMHKLSAVGTAEEVAIDDTGLWIGAKISDDAAFQKVVDKVYKGFSLGGKKTARDDLNKSMITGIRLDEISLVDRPNNPDCVFDIYKAAASDAPPSDAEAFVSQLAEQGIDLSKAAQIFSFLLQNKDREAVLNPLSQFGAEALGKTAPAEKDNGKVLLVGPGDPLADDIQKIASADDLEKYLGQEAWDVRTALNALDFLYSLYGSEQAEAHPEAASQAADLKLAIEKIKSFIASEILENDAALANAAKADDLAKAASENLAKIASLTEDLVKVAAENEDLKKRVTELEAQPEPPQGALLDLFRVVGVDKDAESGIEKAARETDDPVELIKAVHAYGGKVLRT